MNARKTYAIEGDGPYDDDELRKKLRAYCDEHGFFETTTLTVTETTEGGTVGRRVDPGQFLD